VDRIALAVAIGLSLVFGCGVLVGVVLMVSTAIRQIRPARFLRRARPDLLAAGPEDQGADQTASWRGWGGE
jgi:hypothetical protein